MSDHSPVTHLMEATGLSTQISTLKNSSMPVEGMALLVVQQVDWSPVGRHECQPGHGPMQAEWKPAYGTKKAIVVTVETRRAY